MQLIDECTRDRLRPNRILDIALQGRNIQVLNTPQFAWYQGARYPLLETALLYAAIELVVLSEAIEREFQALKGNEMVKVTMTQTGVGWRSVGCRFRLHQ